MRIAGFSDTHLAGAGMPGATNLAWRQNDFVQSFGEVIQQIVHYGPDLVLFAGDAFQARRPHPQWVMEFIRGMMALSSFFPVCVVPGNHDRLPMLVKTELGHRRIDGSILQALTEIGAKNVHYLNEPGTVEIDGAQVFGMPWITGKHLAARAGTTDTDREMEGLACSGIRALLAQPFDGPRIFVGHLTMLGGEFGGFVPVTMGKEIFWQSSWLDGFDAALLGHLHRHQLPDPSRPWICYAGSTERLDFGEREEEKGWVSIDLGAESPEWEFHPVPVRPMVQIEAEAEGTEMFFPDVPEDAILKVILRLGAGQPAPDIRADCRYLLSPTFIWEGRERQFRAPENVREMSMVEQLRAYWESKEIAPDQIAIWLTYAKELMHEQVIL